MEASLGTSPGGLPTRQAGREESAGGSARPRTRGWGPGPAFNFRSRGCPAGSSARGRTLVGYPDTAGRYPPATGDLDPRFEDSPQRSLLSVTTPTGVVVVRVPAEWTASPSPHLPEPAKAELDEVMTSIREGEVPIEQVQATFDHLAARIDAWLDAQLDARLEAPQPSVLTFSDALTRIQITDDNDNDVTEFHALAGSQGLPDPEIPEVPEVTDTLEQFLRT